LRKTVPNDTLVGTNKYFAWRAHRYRIASLARRAATVDISRMLSKWFYDTFTGTAPREQSTVVLLLEGALVSWLLAMREYGGHEDLRVSGRRSVIPYVHG
jgi:hypothetical protein